MNTKLFTTTSVEDIQKRAKELRSDEHDVFAVLVSDRMDALSLTKLKVLECKHGDGCRECPRKYRQELIKAYDASMKEIAKWHNDLKKLTTGVIEAFVWADKSDSYDELKKQKLADESNALPDDPLEIADVLRFEIMLLPEEEIRQVLAGALDETLQKLFDTFKQCLVRLRNKNIVGTVNWYREDVCKYDFYRSRRLERKTGEKIERHTEKQNTHFGLTWSTFAVKTRTQEFGTFDIHEHHEHQLFNAARHQLPACTVSRPSFVSTFVSKIPDWMAPHIFIVEGDMLRDTVDDCEYKVSTRKEVDVTREFLHYNRAVTVGYQRSPAVTIADFVLTGWSGRDM